MAFSTIELTISSLNSDIDTLRSTLNSLKSHSDRMQERIQELGGMWEGPAHEIFNAQFNNDYMALQTLYQTLEELIKCMEYAKAEYQKCEDSVSAAIAAIRI